MKTRQVSYFLPNVFDNIITQSTCTWSVLLFLKITVMFVNFGLCNFLFLWNGQFIQRHVRCDGHFDYSCMYHNICVLCVCLFIMMFMLCDLFLVCCVVDVCINHLKGTGNMKSHPQDICYQQCLPTKKRKTINNKIMIWSKNDELSLCDVQKMNWKRLFKSTLYKY